MFKIEFSRFISHDCANIYLFWSHNETTSFNPFHIFFDIFHLFLQKDGKFSVKNDSRDCFKELPSSFEEI